MTVKTAKNDGCSCGRPFPSVPFDADRVEGLSAAEVRKLFPRKEHKCKCGATTILYASFYHFTAGDW